tara:strand:- start:2380 stop:2553 length:174 start_codon:yes stop_codon:yes gene_type:complete
MPANRFELMTFALQKRCSTAELSRLIEDFNYKAFSLMENLIYFLNLIYSDVLEFQKI